MTLKNYFRDRKIHENYPVMDKKYILCLLRSSKTKRYKVRQGWFEDGGIWENKEMKNPLQKLENEERWELKEWIYL